MPVGKLQPDGLRKRFDALRARIELFLSGRAPDDPLYLTNRTWQQKAKIAAMIAAPVLLLVALVTAGATDLFRFHKVDPYEHPPTEATAPAAPQKRLPDPILAPAELEVVNIRIARDSRATVVTGIVRNNTDQKVDSAEVSYYLADIEGSLLGTDTTDVANVAPHGSVTFRMPLKIAKAEYVIVREVHPN
ncbi:MAG: FxLYD domain-containing protein [Bryobacteraceae bacterium]|jgi:hypothetical protein